MKLLVKDGQATPRTLARIMENLPHSRFTILKHLKEMEMNGLISKSTIAKTTRGRPKILYQPTASLLKGEDVVQIPFSTLSENCIHRDGGKCVKSPNPCEMMRCPILDKNRQ
ncbi:MAG: hypothetical protein HYY22_09750 [Thaumarchaeota archaeon]|nr:hypothetical protein [Nitrososphaerota archaeon]